ncbi:MAG TPA: alpha/beta hydrolase [Solirubrobacterales bacterium]|nr:alpha/beta hydrolase [Solirubrobacterales bacterium]
MPHAIEEGELVVDGVGVFYRRVPGEGIPTVYCHGNPTHGEDWLPFLERGGPAIAIDMPGWGRSDRPDPARFDYSMFGLAAFLERCLGELGVGRRKLVVHDWGCVGLIGAQRRPDLVERLVVMNAVPLLPGYRWHWVAQIWRRRGLGELANATATKSSMGLIMRQLSGDRRAMPPQFLEMIWRHRDQGTNAATLALYRHADPDRLALAGRDLKRLSCPSLVIWGANDPFLRPSFGEAYANALPSSRLEIVPGAGHWPWIDDARVVGTVLDFLGA